MPKGRKRSYETGPLVMGLGGGLLLFSITWALAPSLFTFWSWVTGGIAFLLIGVGLEEILLAVTERSRKRSD